MSPAGWEHYHQLREESEAGDQVTIPQTEQAAHFSPGQQVTWHHTPRGGYGYIIPVDGVVVKVNKATVTIRVQKRDGTSRELCVHPTSLRARACSPEPMPHTGGAAGLSLPTDGTPAGQRPLGQDQPQFKEPSQSRPAQATHPHETVEALAAEIVAEIGEPCRKCGCTLSYRDAIGDHTCHLCLPRPQKYAPGMLTDDQWKRLRALFPRRG